MSAFRIVTQCKCGGAIDAEGTGDDETVRSIERAFWQIHSGTDHGKATVTEARNARRRESRTDLRMGECP